LLKAGPSQQLFFWSQVGLMGFWDVGIFEVFGGFACCHPLSYGPPASPLLHRAPAAKHHAWVLVDMLVKAILVSIV
jgi:hypothetical protein